MSDYARLPDADVSPAPAAKSGADNASVAPGRSTLTEDLPRGTLQMKGGHGEGAQETAAQGFSGSAMDVPYRSEMEHGFGVSFSNVKAYGDDKAASANKSLGSEAYAVGNQVAFASSSPAKEVVAHELAHTIQQSGGAGPVQTWSVGSPGDSYEKEADHAAATVLAGGQAQVQMRTSGTIQRWGGSDHYTIGNTAGQKALAKFQGAFPGKDPGAPEVPVPTQQGGKDGAKDGLGVQQGNKDGTMSPSAAGNSTLGIQTGSGTISFGAASRYSGDYATNVGGLHKLGSETGLDQSGSAGGWVHNKVQFAQMAMGASTNSNHFYPQNGMEYDHHHQQALSHALAAHQAAAAGNAALRDSEMHAAMEEEGFGNHFLQDTHSSGHMAPRALDSVEDMHNDEHSTAAVLAQNAPGVAQSLGNVANKAGNIAGHAVGGAKSFASQVIHLQNPFSEAGREKIASAAHAEGTAMGQSAGGTVQGAVSSTLGQGGMVNAMISGVTDKLPAFIHNAKDGLLKSKQWHDFFCALPDGLPTTLGVNFHGDYYMDGKDLEWVSNTCSDSIMEVLSTAQGKPVPGNVRKPAPNFSAIMADPVAGPAWRVMMTDYRAQLEQAKAQIKPGMTGHTDGGTTFNSEQVLDDINKNVFGGGADDAGQVTISGDPIVALNQARELFKGTVDSLNHFLGATFDQNQNLGSGVDDDLNHKKSLDPHFDVNKLEVTFHLYSQLEENGTRYQQLLTTGIASKGAFAGHDLERMRNEAKVAGDAAAKGRDWKAKAIAGDSIANQALAMISSAGNKLDRATLQATIGRFHTVLSAGGEFRLTASAPKTASGGGKS